MKNISVSKALKDHVMYIVLVALIIIFSIARSNFFSGQNLINVVNQNVSNIVIGIGITFIMLSGAMDLSVGFQVSTISVVMGMLARDGYSTFVIIVAGLLLGVLLSTINGLIYARLKVFPFIITLATQYVLNGATYLLSNSKTFRVFPSAFSFMGGYKFRIPWGDAFINFPLGIIVMIALVCVGAFILNRTYFGRNIYALGSNPDAVALSGISVFKMRVGVFSVAGLFFALGAILTIGRTGASSSGTGLGAEFTVMAGAMLGGVKMGGGGGKMNNMVVGMLIIGLLNNGMNLMNLNTYWQYIAMGVVLLLAITLDTLQTESAFKKAKLVAGGPPEAGPPLNEAEPEQIDSKD